MTSTRQTDITPKPPKRRARGFVQTGGILNGHIRKATEKRGFAESRLLTQWVEIVGPVTAAMAQPVKISYTGQGIGATLTILTNGANAPVLLVELPRIKDRVNACYGYAAISRIRITQTAETGFAEASAAFSPDRRSKPVDPAKSAEVDQSLQSVQSEGLRSALARLGHNILSRTQTGTS